jgi:hypothetical protein
MTARSSNNSSPQKRLSSLRDELIKIETPLYPSNPYLNFKVWTAKAIPTMKVDWSNVFDEFSSLVTVSDWTNLGFAIYSGFVPNSHEHQQAWKKDVTDVEELRQKVLHFLDGLLALPSNNAQDIQRGRSQFLRKLYDITGADESVFVDPAQVGAELGLSGSVLERIYDFLHSQGYIQFDIRDYACITHNGILEVERMLSNSNKLLPHHPSVNYTIQIEQMIGSQIQQGTNQSYQISTDNSNDIEAMRKFVADLKNQLTELPLSPEAQAEVESDISTLESQLKSPRPKSAVLRECLSSIRTVLEGITGNVIAALLMQQIIHLLK